ncbi:MAG: NfeD family protein [Planctomycetota bacterium]
MGLTLIIVIYLISLVLIFAELFVPGGILGIMGAAGLGISLYFGFAEYGRFLGLGQICLTLIILPLILYFGLKRLTLQKELKSSEGFIIKEADHSKFLKAEGTTLTDLRPAGLALINNQKIDVVTEGAFINKNTKIKVFDIQGNRVVVRSVN